MPETYFAFAPRCVRPQAFELGDIRPQDRETDDLAFGVPQRRAAPLNPARSTVLRQDPAFDVRLEHAGCGVAPSIHSVSCPR